MKQIKSLLIPLFISSTLLSCQSEKQEQMKQPNIIYILADDLGYAELGCYGQKKISRSIASS